MVANIEAKMNGAENKVDKGPAFGKRHVQVILMFFLVVVAYPMRVNLSVAIVAMTDNTTSSNPDIPTYDWNDKSVTLSSFYWGYVVLQVFAGKLGRSYGTKWFLVGTMAINSAAFVLIPLFAEKFGSKGVMGCRVVQGLAQGFFFPSVAVLFGQWVPLGERSRLSTTAVSGLGFSNVLSLPLAGYMCASWAGWPSTFYFFGALGFAWIVPWFIFGANSPSEHKTITEGERNYIQKSLGFEEEPQVIHTPWKAILTSIPVWSYILASQGQAWGFVTLLTEMPTYISKVMKFDIHSNSILSAAPYMALLLFSFPFAFISDYMINHGFMTATNTRKLFSTIGLLGPGLSLIVLGFIPETQTALSVALLIAAVGLGGGICSGYQLTSIDLSPNFSGVLTGLANGSANIFSILSPLFVQLIVTDETDRSQWRTIFFVSAGAYIAANIVFVAFGTAKIQWWDSIKSTKENGEAKSVGGKREGKISQISL